MTKERYMALADFQSLWTNSIKPYIVAGFIAMLAGTDANAKNLVLADGTNIAQSTFIAATEKGANSGVATLGADGKVPASQLPSFVDDVLEGYLNATDGKFYEESTYTTEIPAEGGKIYVDLATSKTYRWGGSAYAVISDTLALGETQGTAYEGSKGKQVADNLAAHTGNSDIHVTTNDKTAWSAKYDKPSGGIPSTDMSQAVQDSLALADSAIQQHQDISGKADKDTDAVEGNFAAFDSNGNPVDSGHKHSDYLTTHQDITGKADKVSGATADNFAGLDGNGNLKDSGKSASDFATAAQGTKADSAIQSVKVNGTALTPDSNKAVDIEMPERVTSTDLAGFVV